MSNTIRTSLAAGDLLGRYRIVRQIGAGGMSSVYEAEHVDLDKRVALKALLPQFEGSEEVRLRMLREGKAASSIRHPHVVDISDVGVWQGITYLVMELLEGEDLGQRLRERGSLEVAETADILVPVMAGLAAAHAAGVLHRDLKPGNIFITRGPYGEELPKLVDFGIAKNLTLSEAKPLTETGRVVGTPYYMSPEQVTASPNLDGRSDVYSMGVILYHCLVGRAPFRGESLYTVMTEVVKGSFETLDEVRPDLPSGIRRVVMKAMATSPDDRWSTVSELGLEVAAFASDRIRDQWTPIFSSVSHTPKAAERTSAPVEAALQTGNLSAGFEIPTGDLRPPANRGPWVVLVLLLVLLGTGGWWWANRAPAPSTVPASETPTNMPGTRTAQPTPSPAEDEAADNRDSQPAARASDQPSTPKAEPKPPPRRSRRRRPRPRPPTREVGEAMTGTRKAPAQPSKEKPEPAPETDVELGTNDAPILN